MAQSGYTPILIYGSTTASNAPSAGNLTTSSSGVELAVNAADGKLYYKDDAGVVQVLASKDSASGSFTTLSASSTVTFSATTQNLALGTSQTSGTWTAGGAAQTGTLTLDQSTKAHTLNIGTGATENATTKTINLGTAGVSGSTTTINIGSAVSGATNSITINGNPTFSGGTANGVLYLNGSKVATSGSALVFDGTNLGVGAASPSNPLTVTSDTSAQVRVGTVSTNINARITLAATGTGLNVLGGSGSAPLAFYSASTELMRLDTSGNLGLGVTPSAWGSVFKAFQLGSGAAFVGSSFTTQALMLGNAYSDAGGLKYINSAQASYYQQYLGAHSWYTAASGTAGNAITFTQAMTLDASGNLTLGGTTRGNSLVTANSGIGFEVRDGTQPFYQWYNSGAGVDQKYWRYGPNTSGDLQWQSVNDAYNSASNMLTLSRAGNLGIGTVSPGAKLEAASTTDGDTIRISFPSAATGTTGGGLQFRAYTNSATLVEQGRIQTICTDGSASYGGAMRFMTAGSGSLTEKMRLDSSGNLGIGTTPTQRLEIQGSNPVIRINDTAVSYSYGLQVTSSALRVYDYNAAAERMRIDGSGNLGLGVTPSAWGSFYRALIVGNSGEYLSLWGSSNGDGGANTFGQAGIANNITQGSKYAGNGASSFYLQSGGRHIWYNAPSGTAGNAITFTQAMTLDASGNLLVGTTTATNNLRLNQKLAVVAVGSNTLAGMAISGYSGTTVTARPVFDFNRSRGTTDGSMTAVTGDDYLGTMVWRGSDGTSFIDAAILQGEVDGAVSSSNVPGRITFNTAAGGNMYERARINSGGNLLIGVISAVGGERLNVTKSSAANYVIWAENTGNTNGDQLYRSKLGANCNTTASYHIVCTTGANDKLYVLGNGDVQNANNSYGALSDAKLKENIVDATPKLAQLNQVRVVNYSLKTDPGHKQLGVIAQELEQIFPGMVEEMPDRDAQGNDLGTTTKSVKYSVFVPMLIKAVQEQQALIKQLQADVAALKGN